MTCRAQSQNLVICRDEIRHLGLRGEKNAALGAARASYIVLCTLNSLTTNAGICAMLRQARRAVSRAHFLRACNELGSNGPFALLEAMYGCGEGREGAATGFSSAACLLCGKLFAAVITSCAASPATEQSSPACSCTESAYWYVRKNARCVTRSAAYTSLFARSVRTTWDLRLRSFATARSLAMRSSKSASQDS